MTTTLQESSAGMTQEQLIEKVTAKGWDVQQVTVYPFMSDPEIQNNITGERIKISSL